MSIAKVHLSVNDRLTTIEIDGHPIMCTTRIVIDKQVQSIPRITLDLAVYQGVEIDFDGRVIVDGVHIPDWIAEQVYRKLRERFGVTA